MSDDWGSNLGMLQASGAGTKSAGDMPISQPGMMQAAGSGANDWGSNFKQSAPVTSRGMNTASGAGAKNNWLPFIGGGLATAGLAAMSFFGSGRKANNFDRVDNALIPIAGVPEAPPLPSVDDYGGAKDSIVPSLTSVSNRDNRFGSVPRVFGKKVRIVPPLAVVPAVSATAIYQTISGIFECGPGELEFEQPKLNDRAASDYPSLTLEYQYGKSDDAALSLYTQIQVNTPPNAELKDEAVSTVQKCGYKASRIDLCITFPNGLYNRVATTTNGVTTVTLQNRTVHFYVVVRGVNGGGAVVTDYPDAVGAQAEPYFKPLTYFVPEGDYEVLVARVDSPESTDPNIQDACIWTDCVAAAQGPVFYDIKNSQGDIVRMARIGYRAQSTENLNGSLGEFSILASSKLAAWNGTSWDAPAVSANPAWIITTALKEAANYRPVTDARLDLPAFKAFAEWCDTKGFEYNKVWEGGDLYSFCEEVARAGRAVFYTRDGVYSVLVDKPVETFAQIFSLRNIVRQSFTAKYSFVEPPDYISVAWVNPDQEWQQDTYDVYDDGKVENVDFKNETLTLPGVTKHDQVYKLARYLQAANKYRTVIYQFSTDIEGLRCEMGDKILVVHDRIGLGLGQGRIVSVSTNGSGEITAITLDAAQTMDSVTNFGIVIRLKDGTLVRRQVVSGNVSTKTLTLSTVIPNSGTLPEPGDLVVFGTLANEGRELLITNIEPQQDLSCVITAVDYAPGIYEADAGAVPAYTPVTSRPRNIDRVVPVPVILFAQSNEDVLETAGDGSLVTKVLLTLQAPAGPVTDYEYQVSRTGLENWSKAQIAKANGSYLSIYGVEDGVSYDMRVRAKNGNYASNEWAYERNHLVIGKTTPPPSVTSFWKMPGSNVIAWLDILRPRDFAGYRVRMAWGDNETLAQATVLCNLTGQTQFDLGHFAKGLKTISVVAVDVAGNESTAPAYLKTDFGDIDVDNAVLTLSLAPTFPGDKTDCSVVGGELHADDDGSNFYVAGENALMYSNNDDDDMYTIVYKEAVYSDIFTPPSTYAFPYRWYIQSNISASGYRIEYQTLNDSNFYSEGPGADDEQIYDADGSAPFYQETASEWLPFPTNGFEFNEVISVRWRLTLFGGVYQGKVIQFDHVLDLPDKVVTYTGVAIGSGGTRLPTPSDFSSVQFVSVTLRDAVGVGWSVGEKTSPLGPVINLFNTTTGAGVSGTIDAEVRGIA